MSVKSGFLSKALNAAAEWLKTEFPSEETTDKLREQGWKIESYYPDAAAASFGGGLPVTTRYTPEGQIVIPGTEEDARYKAAVKAIITAQPKP